MKAYHKIQTVFKRDPKNNYKTLLMGEYSLPEFEYLKNNDWIFTEKVDGCLHYGQLVLTDQGRIPIGKIVNERLPVKVVSYNVHLGLVEFCDIEHYHKEQRVRPFISVAVQSRKKGNRPKYIVCTDNHKFYSNHKWIRADKLLPGDSIAHFGNKITESTKQIILGSLLGDASIYCPSKTTRGVSFIHSIKQSDYFTWKSNLLGNLFKECIGAKGGFPGSLENRRGNSVINPSISEIIINLCEIEGKKKVTQKWVDSLLPQAIAVWYMDDGSCQFASKQRPRVRIATNGFSFKEADLLCCMLYNKFGIDAKVFDYNGATILLSADSTERFFNIIYPYVPQCMKYKLPSEYYDIPCVLPIKEPSYSGLLKTAVLDVSYNLPKRAKAQQGFQYDLSILGNSNYFTNDILVHNTNIRVMHDGAEKITFGGKTDNAQMPVPLVEELQRMFLARLPVFKEVFPNTEVCFYGEGYGGKIQKAGATYGEKQRFVLFDILIGEMWLQRKDVIEIATHFDGLDVVPVVGFGSLLKMVKLAKEGFLSPWGNFPAEGIVARPLAELRTRRGERVITKIKYKDFVKEG